VRERTRAATSALQGAVVSKKQLIEVALPLEAENRSSLAEFLTIADSRRRESRPYVERPSAVVPPGRGLSPSMREAFAESVELAEVEPISIRWQVDAAESPIKADLADAALRQVLRGLVSRFAGEGRPRGVGTATDRSRAG